MQYTIRLLFLIITTVSFSQSRFPGGVSGAEVWYKVNHNNISSSIYPNFAGGSIILEACLPPNITLFNFNHSSGIDELCLTFNASLEITNSRNIFFVGEPFYEENLSQVTTGWDPNLTIDSVSKNRFDIAEKNFYQDKKFLEYEPHANAYINFYNWNKYQLERRYKSYGIKGETKFYIGKEFHNDNTIGRAFKGNFPEFISFPFELTANQQNRIESYLALKYGITLNQGKNYRSAKNIIFWNKENNNLFSNRIFGIGRDTISDLHQLQSESVHNKNYLVKSVQDIQVSNEEQWNKGIFIENEQFIVSGDNGGVIELDEKNQFQVQSLKRKWLSQITGQGADTIPLTFKFKYGPGPIKDVKSNNPEMKIWMLHDKNTTNNEVSDFNSQFVEYYDALDDDGEFVQFREINFDTDNSLYDQYTFGIGPEVIVQIRYDSSLCDHTQGQAYAVITGGKAPYDVYIVSNGNLLQHTHGDDNTVYFPVDLPQEYLVEVKDANGAIATSTTQLNPVFLTVDLGLDQTLDNDNPEIVLDPGVVAQDPDATYEWYYNGERIEFTTPTITVDQPGEYKVIVTGGNRICIKEDTILIDYSFKGTIITDCDTDRFNISVTLQEGLAPFITTITGTNYSVTTVNQERNYTVQNIPFGQYTVKVTDSNGKVLEQPIHNPIPGIIVDLEAQIQNICSIAEPQGIFQYPPYLSCEGIIDASVLVSNPNVTYEWLMNGQPMGITGPVVEVSQQGGDFSGGVQFFGLFYSYNEFTVKITNTLTGCSVTDTFALTKATGIRGITPPASALKNSQPEKIASNHTQPVTDVSVKTTLYPNPSRSGETFYYEASSSIPFEGIVEIFTPTGALVQQFTIEGKNAYSVPLNLNTAGVYFVCTKTGGNLITNKIVIQ